MTRTSARTADSAINAVTAIDALATDATGPRIAATASGDGSGGSRQSMTQPPGSAATR